MRILLSNGDYAYTNNTESRLLDINNKAYLVGDNLNIVSDSSTYRLSIDSPVYLEEYDNQEWVETDLYIPSDSIPQSLNADDTFNFEGFGLPLLLTVFFSVFVVFCVFKRR